MNIVLSSWIYSFLIAGLVDTSIIRTAPCQHYEVLVCGDADREWSICETKTPGVNRILSAHLDTRYANRYCRRYGTPENFGLTNSGRAMWTVAWCFGTFFLCLDLDPDFYRDSDSNVRDTYTSFEYDSTTPPDLIPSQSTTIVNTKQITTKTTIFQKDINQEISNSANLVAESGTLEADDSTEDEKNVQSASQRANNSSLNAGDEGEIIADNKYGLNPRLKFWLIFAIASGGLVIVILIGVIAYLSMKCCDSNPEDVPVCKSKNSSSEKYFRQQKLSTSALVTSESDYCTDVYDFIPANNSTKRTHNSKKFKPFDKLNDKRTENNTSEKENDKICRNSADRSGSMKESNTSRRSEYFVLIPHNISDSSSHSDNNNVQVYTHVAENIYDHLIHSPATPIPDASTYHHLNFQRDISNTETSVESGQVAIN